MKTSLLCMAIGVALVMCAVGCAAHGSPKCLDERGDPVDWWVILKFPVGSSDQNQDAASGFGYAYMDANNPTLTVADGRLDTNLGGALGSTLGQLWKERDPNQHAWLMYDDEWPNGHKWGSRAHMKGELMFDNQQGFWLVHSVPRFPPFLNDTYTFPDNEKKYGQSFQCNTFGYSQLQSISGLLQIDAPAVWDSNVPTSMNQPTLTDVVNGHFITAVSANWTNLVTLNGVTIKAFAKNKEWDQDLYEDLVAPTFNDDIMAETWMNGVNPLPTYCKPQYQYNAINIRTLAIQDRMGNTISWKETQDHSKWAYTVNQKWICIGDQNRQHGQRVRGGGQYCRQDSNMHAQFSQLVVTADQC